jgi:hypothetical protein
MKADTGRWGRIRTNAADDQGIALAMVLLITVAVSGLIASMVIVGTGSLRSATGHAKFDQSLAAAEAGLDSMLAELQSDQGFSNVGSVPSSWATSPPTEAVEQAWARAAILAEGSGSLVDAGVGEYVAIKPAGWNSVYAMGWSPSKAAPKATARLVKAEYLFSPYKPGNAILTSGNLSFSSSVTVDVATGLVGKANVHTNGGVNGTGCSQTVNGTVTSSGAYGVCGSVGDTGSGGGYPIEDVPEINTRYVYDKFASSYAATSWYDLCNDGTVKRPGTTPCSGTQLADVSGGGTYRGWSYGSGSGTTAPIWTMGSTSWGPGIYYAYRSDATMDRNTNVASATVIAEGAPTGGPTSRCGMKGGKITAKLVGIGSAALPGVVFMADDDLEVTANFEGGVGLFGAGNQVKLETSSNGITGTVIANDKCTAGGDRNEVKNAVVNYDRNVEVPLLDMIRTTQWLELKSGA